MIYQFCVTKNNKVKIVSVISVAVVAISLLFISPTINLTFASTIQPPLTAIPNQILTKNNVGVIILEGATVIDGTGALPKPNTTIVINGSRITYLSSDTANNYDLNS